MKVKGAAQQVIVMKMESNERLKKESKSPRRTKIGEEMSLLRKVEKDPKIVLLKSPQLSPRVLERRENKENT